MLAEGYLTSIFRLILKKVSFLDFFFLLLDDSLGLAFLLVIK